MDSISLAYGYGWRNAGDMAINEGSIQFINSLLPDTVPDVISIHPEGTTEYETAAAYLESDELSYRLSGGPMQYDPKNQSAVEQAVSLSGDGMRYLLDRTKVSRFSEDLETEMAKTIRDSDFFFSNGGNLIHHKRSLSYLLGVLYPIQVAKQYDVPYGLLPHTIFDIEGRYEPLIRSILDGSEFVWTRDNRSYEYLTSEFPLKCPIRNGIDTAFFTNSTNETNAADGDRIAVVPRFSTLGDTGELEDDETEAEFKRFVSRLADRGYDVQLTVQTKVEEEWVDENPALLREDGVEVFKSFSPKELRTHYQDVDMLVTMRLHAGIFALSVGTPSVGLYRDEWGPKTPGTWENLDIEEYALTCEEMSVEPLLEMCEEILDNQTELGERITRNIDEKKEYMIEETQSLMNAP